MIVVATNNGSEYLPKLLDSIQKYGWYGHSVLIVDTGSTDMKFKRYLESLTDDENRKYPFVIYCSENKKWVEEQGYVWGGYDTGAYLKAYKDNKEFEDVFIFMQDSFEIKSSNWIPEFYSKLTDNNLVAWL